MKIDLISLFPEYFSGPFDVSIIKRAREKGLLDLRHVDLRLFGVGKHRKVDDRPYGGGPGMVLKPEPVCAALESVCRPESRVIYLSASGKVLTQKKCRELVQYPHLVLLAGHYEGIDERIIRKKVDEEISIGEYVLTNGGLAAMVLIDAVTRLIPGVLGNELSSVYESYEHEGFDYPTYTRPEIYEGERVPEVLLSGNHEEIAAYRTSESLRKKRRED